MEIWSGHKFSTYVIIDLHYDIDFEAGCPIPSLGRFLNMVNVSVKYKHNPTGGFKILGTETQMQRLNNVKTGYPSRHIGHKLKIIST